MAWSPGAEKKQGAGCLIALGGLFALIGGVPAWVVIYQAITGTVQKDLAGPGVMGGIFIIAGLAMAWSGFNRGRRGLRVELPPPQQTSWRESDCFPDEPPHRRSDRGVRLQAELSLLARTIFIGGFALVWNAVTIAAAVVVYRTSGPQVLPLVLFGCLGIVGVILSITAIRELLRYLTVGRTSLEIDRIRLKPGEESRIAIYQEGSFPINELKVFLICQESVAYRRGTRRIIDENVFFSELIHHERNLAARGIMPMGEVRFAVPGDAMHSFKAPNNEINWMIRVHMDIPNKPDVTDEFHFLVSPEVTPG